METGIHTAWAARFPAVLAPLGAACSHCELVGSAFFVFALALTLGCTVGPDLLVDCTGGRGLRMLLSSFSLCHAH